MRGLTDDSLLQFAKFDCGLVAADLNEGWPMGAPSSITLGAAAVFLLG